MAWCRQATSHYLNQCLNAINELCHIHIRAISQEILMIPLCKMSLKITFLKTLPHSLGSNKKTQNTCIQWCLVSIICWQRAVTPQWCFNYVLTACECDPVGSSNMQCDKVSGQCVCRDTTGNTITGRQCNECIDNYYNLQQSGCTGEYECLYVYIYIYIFPSM